MAISEDDGEFEIDLTPETAQEPPIQLTYEPPDNDHCLRFDIFRMLIRYEGMRAEDIPKMIGDIEQAVLGKRPRIVRAVAE